jgi:colanic acid biosynthesis protein WcaH
MSLDEHVKALETAIGDARTGLPEPVFDFLCRITPIVNVDLLIRNQRGQTLLTWRHDDLYLGWHVPGGVVRFKERMADRIAAVARTELGASVKLTRAEPVAMHEVIQPVRIARGHFISFLFECELTSPLDLRLAYAGNGTPENGQWGWHDTYPPAMIGSHEMYRRFIDHQA